MVVSLCLVLIGRKSGARAQKRAPSLRIIQYRMRGVVSSDFIRIKMAEVIPPDKGQLVCVGELICPPPKTKQNSENRKPKNNTTPSTSAAKLLLNNSRVACCQAIFAWE